MRQRGRAEFIPTWPLQGRSPVAGQPLPTSDNDTILGRGGSDLLFGLGGNDTIHLDQAAFAGIGGAGALDASHFLARAKARDADDHILYHKPTGRIFYDENGGDSGGKTLFATVDPGTTLHASDFLVI